MGHLKAGLLTNDGSLDLGSIGTPLPFHLAFRWILQFPTVKCKRMIIGTPPGFSFIICTMTELAGRDHHWVLSPSLHSKCRASGRSSGITTPGQHCWPVGKAGLFTKVMLPDGPSKPSSLLVIYSVGVCPPCWRTSKNEKGKKEAVGERQYFCFFFCSNLLLFIIFSFRCALLIYYHFCSHSTLP